MVVPSLKLHDLIDEIRGAKREAQEQEMIWKECAHIRASFRDRNPLHTHRQLAKLLYVHMLGYPAHFGQMECLKLIASPRVSDKRVGYLGAMLLLDERQDAHRLITNSIKNDLSQGIQPVQGLALCTLSTMGCAEMCQDLATEVEKLLLQPSPYGHKKAVLTAVHDSESPELSNIFLPLCAQLLHERHHSKATGLPIACFHSLWTKEVKVATGIPAHRRATHMQLCKLFLAPAPPFASPTMTPGILLGTITLIMKLCKGSPAALRHFQKVVPQLVQILRTLVTLRYCTEHGISGISDPFLQVQILHLLRIWGRNHEESSETTNDLLAQVATDTETSRNAGSAVLLETVLTIMDICSAAGLRVLAVNILGCFLLNSDKNIRYIALTLLLRLVQSDHGAVQQHWPIVVECLQETDAFLSRQALAMSLALVNSSNVQSMTQELQGFLESCPPDLWADCASGILLAAERFAPTKRRHIDTILHVLTTAGTHVQDDAVANLTHLTGGAQELHACSVHRLYNAPAEDISQQPLVQVAAWCTGQYQDLLEGSCEETEPLQVACIGGALREVLKGGRSGPWGHRLCPLLKVEEEMLVLLEKVLHSLMSLLATGYTLTALMKLSTRFREDNHIWQVVSIYGSCLDVELQQRAVEYNTLFGKYDHMRAAILEKMPLVKGGPQADKETEESKEAQLSEAAPVPEPQASKLLDLLDLLNGTSGNAQHPPPLDPSPEGTLVHLLDLPCAPPPLAPIPKVKGFEHEGLQLNLSFVQPSEIPALLLITATATNSSGSDVRNGLGTPGKEAIKWRRGWEREGEMGREWCADTSIEELWEEGLNYWVWRVASQPADLLCSAQTSYAQSFQLQLQAPSGDTVPAKGGLPITQLLRILNPNKAPLRLKLRFTYNHSGQSVQEIFEVNNLPLETWQ
ncbi:LOW QUALITY PROTEIN: AP-1 complex subunit gamma-like 2 [Trichechus inunguis]